MNRLLKVVVGVVWVAGAAGARAGEPTAAPEPPARPAAAAPQPASRVDINSASLAELKALPGIGDKQARRIVAGRPWSTKIDLVTKGVIPQGIYTALKNRIVVLHPAMPPARK